MPIVYCSLNCQFSEHGECQCDEIQFDGMGSCLDYEKRAKECPDKYFAFCIDYLNEIPNEKIARCWEPRMGIKDTFWGREVFLNGYDDNYFTDGRTGVAGNKEGLLAKSKEELDKIFAELEENNGISPLYTTITKWPIKERPDFETLANLKP